MNDFGGIQTFSKFMIQALCVSGSNAIDIYAKNDINATGNELAKIKRYFKFGRIPKFIRSVFFGLVVFWRSATKRPDLIIVGHAHFSPLAALLKQLFRIRFIVVVHGIEIWNIKRPWLKKSLESADKVVAVSEYTKQKLVSQNYHCPENIEVFYNTFDERKFQILKKDKKLLLRHGIQEHEKVLLSVCRLVDSRSRKGYDLVLDALSFLEENLHDLKYVIVGDGGDRGRIEKKIQRMNLSKCVILAGEVSGEDLPRYYQSADLFVMPSEREGFGIVYLEAMACGLPVVAARCAGASEALQDGALGDLIAPGDSIGLAEKIRQKLLSGEMTMQEKEILRRKVVSAFGFQQFSNGLSNIINKVLNAQSSD